MPRLAKVLVEMGLCTPDRIREAMQNQAIFGGRLGTNLLELGAISEAEIASALGKRHGVPAMHGEIALDPATLPLIPRALADRLEAIPFRNDGRKLQVLVSDPANVRGLDELAFATGKTVIPIVVPEARLWLLLRRAYGIERQLRAMDFESGGLGATEPIIRGEALGEGDDGPPQDLQDEDSFHQLYGRSGMTEAAAAAQPQATPGQPQTPVGTAAKGAQHSAPASAASAPAPAPAVPVPSSDADDGELLELSQDDMLLDDLPPLSFDEAVQVLTTVADRDAIAQTVLRYARSKFKRAVLLTIQRGHALGWEGIGEGLTAAGVRRIRVPLGMPSAIDTAVSSRAHYLGPLQKTEANIRFLRVLSGGAPKNSLLIPILVLGRVVNVLYADNGRGGLVDSDIGELLILATRIAQSYDAIIAASINA